MLLQEGYPVAYFSQKLNGPFRNYPTYAISFMHL